MSFDFNSLVSALSGSLIGGMFVLIGVGIKEYLDKKRDKQKVKNIIKGISIEINTIWDMYINRVGTLLEELSDEEMFGYIYPINQDYFTVYSNNADLIGSIENKNISNSIIKIYTMAKGLIDSFQLNNQMLEKVEEYENTNNELKYTYEDILRKYSANLKKLHYDLKKEIEILDTLLSNE